MQTVLTWTWPYDVKDWHAKTGVYLKLARLHHVQVQARLDHTGVPTPHPTCGASSWGTSLPAWALPAGANSAGPCSNQSPKA